MKAHDELREVVRAEYGRSNSSAAIDRRLRQVYGELGEMPVRKPGKKVIRWVGSAAGGLAACFVLLIGVSVVNPALAAGIPGMESIVSFLRGGYGSGTVVAEGGVDQYVQPVAATGEKEAGGLQVTESYFDGKTLVLGVKLTLENAPEEYRILSPEYALSFRAQGREIPVEYHPGDLNSAMRRLDDTTYVGAVTMDLEKARLPETTEVTLGIASLTAVDTKMMVLLPDNSGEASSYQAKTYEIAWEDQPFVFEITKNEGLQRVYEVGETKNACTLERVIITPAVTEVDVSADVDSRLVVVVYDSLGNELAQAHDYATQREDPYARQCFKALPKSSTSVTVKFFSMDNKYDSVAEFVVPVDGGYAQEPVASPWEDEDIPIVYDPPVPEMDSNIRNRENIQVVELGETYTPTLDALGLSSGSIDATYGNLQIFDSLEAAGIAEKDMNCFEYLLEGLENGECKVVLLDLTLEAHDAVGVGTEGRGTVGLSIASLAASSPVNSDLMGKEESGISGEIEYFSEHSNGFKDYYAFTLGANETKTVKVGYVVPTKQLEQGNFQLMTICPEWNTPLEISQTEISVVHGGYCINIPALSE